MSIDRLSADSVAISVPQRFWRQLWTALYFLATGEMHFGREARIRLFGLSRERLENEVRA